MQPSLRNHVAQGFSLIELLVVISIIAVLAGMVLSGVRVARDAAKLMVCGRQMQQVVLAWNAYRADWENLAVPVYPADPNWNTWSTWVHRPWERRWQHELAENYLETYKVFNCPTAKAMYPNAAVLDAPLGAFPRGASTANGVPTGWSICLMAYNSQAWGRAASWTWNLGSAPYNYPVPGPMTEGRVQRYLAPLAGAKLDRCPVFFDGKWQNDGSNHKNNGNGVWWPHRGKRSPMAFKDGHVETVAYSQVTSWAPLQVL